MSSHAGVSCDSCAKTNFSGRRYKCLSCDNYDLCGACYDTDSESHNHLRSHPMQCILSKTSYEVFYGGETISHRTLVSLTCPYCGISGFLSNTLLKHCLEKHSIISSDKPSNQVVMCPLCVLSPVQAHQARFVSLADHLVREHDDESNSLFNHQPTSREKGKDQLADFGDQEDEDDDGEEENEDGLPLYILAERLFAKADNHLPSLAEAIVRNYCNPVEQGTAALQRRSFTRHGNTRNHFNNHPYGTIPRTTTTGSLHIPFDATIESSIPSEPYTRNFSFYEPLSDFESSLSDIPVNASIFVRSALPGHIGSLPNEPVVRKKATRPAMSIEPPTTDYSLWQKNVPVVLNHLKPSVNTENTNKTDSRSLLEKIFQTDCETNRTRPNTSAHNHTLFLQSLILSSLNISINKA
ncbi:unnamed protein product [Adineta ricciae]|uniref:RING-type E3 ubiquitin transferase n=1 Tax=Adineta ricciae TaxID=249248 RepID=A0A815FD76_ADIRI|nr:unnamed protein product [Adineta ricciae]